VTISRKKICALYTYKFALQRYCFSESEFIPQDIILFCLQQQQ